MSNVYPANAAPEKPMFPIPAPSFRRQVIKAAGCVLLFFLAYIVLLLIMTALAAACIAGGVVLALAIHKMLAFIAALVLVILGGMLLLLLASFVFSRAPRQWPRRMLLQSSEHPRLFSFVAALTSTLQIRFPRKIFAIPGVTAAMSAPSLFWRPAAGQLEIGLGLVNSLNLSEFQMVLARTLGRFSRPGMQMGNYISWHHQWIYHRLYEHGNRYTTVVRRAGRSLVLRPFSRIAIAVANGIEYLLRGLFGVLNRAYLPLNREMEFYADAVGVHVAGSQAAVSAMHRVALGSFCLDQCLHELPPLAAARLRFRNLYETHGAMLRHYAARNHLSTDATGLPVITEVYRHSFVRSRVQFRSKGASQPGLEEREARCIAAAVDGPLLSQSAWELFPEPARLQENMTMLLYNQGPGACEEYEWCDTASFMLGQEQRYHQYEFPRAFNGYYDNRPFPALTPAHRQPLTTAELAQCGFDTIYAVEHAIRIKQLFRDLHDAETLLAISEGQMAVTRFEFDGHSYPAAGAAALLGTLQAAVQQQANWLQAHDSLAFRFHYTRAMLQGKEQTMLQLYESVLQHQAKAQLLSDQVARIVHCTGMLFSVPDVTMEEALPWFDILDAESGQFRTLLKELWQQPAVVAGWEAGLKQQAAHFLSRQYSYLDDHTPRFQEIQLLQEISGAVLEHYNNYVTFARKRYLDFVIEINPQASIHGPRPVR